MARRDLPLQRIAKRVEERGTEGKFRRWCQRRGHRSVTAECIKEGLAAGGNPAEMAKAAKAFASARVGRRKRV